MKKDLASSPLALDAQGAAALPAAAKAMPVDAPKTNPSTISIAKKSPVELDIAVKQQRETGTPSAGNGDKCSIRGSKAAVPQHFVLRESPGSRILKHSQRRLTEGDEETLMDLVDVEDLEHFVGCDMRTPRGTPKGLIVSGGGIQEALMNPTSGTSAALRGAAVPLPAAGAAAAAADFAGDKLASLHVDQEDQSFLRSSKYSAVARRILALIESRRFGQNNIPWEELADPDPDPDPASDLADLNAARQTASDKKKGGSDSAAQNAAQASRCDAADGGPGSPCNHFFSTG